MLDPESEGAFIFEDAVELESGIYRHTRRILREAGVFERSRRFPAAMTAEQVAAALWALEVVPDPVKLGRMNTKKAPGSARSYPPPQANMHNPNINLNRF